MFRAILSTRRRNWTRGLRRTVFVPHMMMRRMNSEMESKFNKKKTERINELWALSKTRELTPEETAERDALRKEYLEWFRASIRGEKTK